MQDALRPYVTAGIAIVGASLIAVTPAVPPPTSVQQRSIKLVDYSEVDYSQLLSNTEANWSGLESILSSSHWLTDPDISQGLTTLFSDLSTGASNPVTNPLSLLTEGSLGLLSLDYAANAASNALTGVSDNIQSALSAGNYTAALTDLENAGSTVLNAFFNGSSDSVGSGLISPEFGLLTNTTDGAATGQIDALAQISNTIADEVANLGGANLTTGSLPLITGNLDLTVSLNQILTDLGLPSGFSVNDLLTDLGLSPTANVLPSLTVGDLLSDLNLTDSSGISLGSILSDLGSNADISLGQILGDLGLSDSSGISLGSILSDLGSSTDISVSSLLGDLGLSDTSGISLGSILSDLGSSTDISVGSILTDLGLSDTSGISLGTVLSDLGFSDSSGISVSSILSDLGVSSSGDLSFSIPTIPVSTLLTDLGIDSSGTLSGLSVSIPVDTLLSDIGIQTSGNITLPVSLDSIIQPLVSGTVYNTIKSLLGSTGSNDLSIPISDVYSALGLSSLVGSNGDITIGLPSISVSTILTDLGVNTNGDITLPSLTVPISTILTDLGINSGGNISLGDILGALGLSDTDTAINIGQVLSSLGLSDTDTIGLSSILSSLGLSSTDSLTIGDVLSALGISSTDTIDLSSLLSSLGLSSTDELTIGDVLSYLGLGDSDSIGLSSILSGLGLSSTDSLTLGDVLSALGITDSSTIPLPSFSIDNILTDLGINPDSSLLTDLGIPSTLTLDPSLDLDGGPVATYFQDLSQDALAALGSISPLASDLSTLLTNDPTLDLTSLVSGLLTDLGVPGVVAGGDLSADLTNIVAELLPGLF
jgi:hypothetical protein